MHGSTAFADPACGAADGECGDEWDVDGGYLGPVRAPAVRPVPRRQSTAYPVLAPASALRAASPPAASPPAEDRVRDEPGPVRESVEQLQTRIRQMQGTRLDTRDLPTHPAIAALLPGGGLKQGAAYSVERSATLLMALLAGPSAAGSWCGVVGVPEFGVEAASTYGIDLDRLVLVPHPGDQWLAATAAIADVLTVVVTRPPAHASDGSVARLAARLRQRGSTLIVLGTWPQTDAMLSISRSRWSGIGDGFGHLASREVTVTVSSRASGRPRSAELLLPDDLRPGARTSGARPSAARPSAAGRLESGPLGVRPRAEPDRSAGLQPEFEEAMAG